MKILYQKKKNLSGQKNSLEKGENYTILGDIMLEKKNDMKPRLSRKNF